MSHEFGGKHELGQNFLIDRAVITRIGALAARAHGPIIELGPGNGALTSELASGGRPVTAVELDPKRVRELRARTPKQVSVVHADILSYRFPKRPHILVGNIPFHLTTAVLKRVLAAKHWQQAILLVQWEVARRRAGIGGTSMLTASWWPWYEFTLHDRVPAHAFRPVPSVDGGLFSMHRRERPLVAERERGPYQGFVKQVFTGRGHGLREILRRTGRIHARELDSWLRREKLAPRTLPKQLSAQQWASLWHSTRHRTPQK